MLVRGNAAIGFWDLKYIYLFGLPEVPPAAVPGPFPPEPQPDPASLAQRVQVLETIVFDLVGGRTADPSPQPSRQSVFQDTKLQLEAVERLTKRFESGLQQLKQEHDRLTTNQLDTKPVR
jgi:hypothetical protein